MTPLDASRQYARRAERLSWLRVLLFLLGLALGWMGLAATGAGVGIVAVLLTLVVLAFTGVARAQRRAERTSGWYRALAQVAEERRARLERRWEELPHTPAPAVAGDHPYAADLDVAGGRASLLQLLGPLGAATGARVAARWLLEPAAPAVVRARQEAVRDLAPRTAFREALAARARLAGQARRTDVGRFLDWAEAEPWLAGRPALSGARWLLPAAWIAGALLVAADVAPASVLSLPLLGGVALAGVAGRGTLRTLGGAAPGSATFRVFAEQFDALVREPVEAPMLRRLQDGLITDGVPAPLALRRLRRVLDAAELRYSPMLHGVVNVLTAWDLHVVAALERWQRGAGRRARAWFEALGEVEALAAFAGLLHDQPGWTLPELDEGADRVEAAGIGHPLLPPAACVRNDACVGPAGRFLFVTGSNMAGKSTLLRAIGANAVLALAGAPVCAERLRLPPVAVLTSMRVSDSLAAGLSFFMAELVRLKGVVEGARRAAADPSLPRPLYLLDEILQGTNSAERQVAARRIVRHLLDAGAIGAVSTHDLGLADTPDLGAAAVPVHFRETLAAGPDGPRMTFDYLLRPGPATSANAMRLVEMIGL